MPLALVALDIYSDGNLLYYMKSFTQWATNTTNFIINSTNVTELQNSTTSAETGNQQGGIALRGLFDTSCIILFVSMLNLILGNPFKTLIRNARSSALMASRELESEDVPLPMGEYFFTYLEVVKNIARIAKLPKWAKKGFI